MRGMRNENVQAMKHPEFFITILLGAIHCFIVYKGMKPNYKKWSWFPICGGILIVVMMYYACIYLDFFSMFVAPLAFIPYFLTLGGQLSMMNDRTLKIVSSLTLIIFYFTCIMTGRLMYGGSFYHG